MAAIAAINRFSINLFLYMTAVPGTEDGIWTWPYDSARLLTNKGRS